MRRRAKLIGVKASLEVDRNSKKALYGSSGVCPTCSMRQTPLGQLSSRGEVVLSHLLELAKWGLRLSRAIRNHVAGREYWRSWEAVTRNRRKRLVIADSRSVGSP